MLTGQSRMKKRASWIRDRRAVMVSAARFVFPSPTKFRVVTSPADAKSECLQSAQVASEHCSLSSGTSGKPLARFHQRERKEFIIQIAAAARAHLIGALSTLFQGGLWVRGLLETRPAPGGAPENVSSWLRGFAPSLRRITCLLKRC